MQETIRNMPTWGLDLTRDMFFSRSNTSSQKAKKACLAASLTCKVAGCTGLEPATSDVTGRRSNQLS